MDVDKNLKMLSDYCDFSEPSAVYILLMLPRKKENSSQVEREKLDKRVRYVVQNMEEVKYALEEFDRYSKLYPEVIFRIYISVNRRSLLKGMMNFQKKLIDFNKDLINGNQQVWSPVAKLGSEFKSVLAKKESKFDRRFFFDIDLDNKTPRDIQIASDFVEEVGKQTKILYYGLSKSGFALVTEPCNPNNLPKIEGIEMKTDSYLYVDILNDMEEITRNL